MRQITYITLLFTGLLFSCKSNKKVPEKSDVTTIARSDSQSEYFFTKGMGFFLQEDYTNAINYFEQALKESERNSAIHYKLGESYYLRGSFHRGIQHLNKAIEIDGDNLPYYLVLADIYISQQEYQLAAEVYENMLHKNPDAIAYYYETANLFKQIGMFEADKLKTFGGDDTKQRKEIENKMAIPLKKAILYFDKFEDTHGVSEDVVLEKYSIYSFLKETHEAEKELQKLISEYPQEPKYKVELARFYFQQKEANKGIEYLEEQVRINPTEPEYRMALAEMYQLQSNTEKSNEHLIAVFDSPYYSIHNKVKIISGMLQGSDKTKHELALNMAEKTVKSNGDYPQAHSILGDAHYINNNKEEARKAYLESIKIDNSTYLVWEQVIFIDAALEDYNALIEHANECLKIHPNKSAILYYLGAAYASSNLNEKAKHAFEQGLKNEQNNPTLEFQFLSQLGDIYNVLKDFEKSDSVYEKALIYDPNSAHVLNNYSYFLSLRGEKLQLAKSMSSKLIKIHTKEPNYIDTYAWVLYKLGEHKEAEKQLSTALKSSQDPAILEHYGDVLFKLGKRDEALKYWKKAQGGKGVSDFLDKKIKERTLYE